MPTPTYRDTSYQFYTIGAVDPNYDNVWGFANPTERNTFLNKHKSLLVSGCKYWKQGDSIRINASGSSGYSFENSYAYDYVKITNRPGTSWEKVYYCFIIDRRYINLNTTELTVVVDYFQTYYFISTTPFWSVSGYGVQTTKLSALPKRGMGAEYPIPCRQNYWVSKPSTGYAFVIYSSISISGTYNSNAITYDNDFTSGVIVAASGMIDGVPMGSIPYFIYCNTDTITSECLAILIKDLNDSGQLGSLTGIYCLPGSYCPFNKANKIQTSAPGWGEGDFTPVTLTKTITTTVPLPSALTLQSVVNSAILYDFDYLQIVISNMQGEEAYYRYCDFTGAPKFVSAVSFAAGYPVLMIYPDTNYKYGTTNAKELYALKQTCPPSGSWTSDNYSIWQAQNQNSRAAAIDAANLTIANAKEVREKTGGIATMLDNLFDQAGDSLTENLQNLFGGQLNLSEDVQNALTTGAYGGLNGLLKVSGLSAFGLEASYVYNQQVAVAEQALKNVEASFADMKYIPTTAGGSNAYGDLMKLAQYGFMIMVTGPTSDYFTDIDSVMESSGHMCKGSVTITKSRTKFDYYQILEAKVVNSPANRPFFVTQMMQQKLSEGLYFWWVQSDGDLPISDFKHPYGITNTPV